MSLLTIVQDSLREIGSVEVPTSIVGSANPTAIQALALSNRSLKQTARRIKWKNIRRKASITTLAQEEQALESDFVSIINETFWSETDDSRIEGPLTADEWYEVTVADTSTGVPTYFRIFRSATSNVRVIHLHPTPTAGKALVYEYRSNALTQTSGGVLQSNRFLADTDTALIDEDLLTLDFTWRFLKSKGFPYAEELKDFEDALAELSGAEGARKAYFGTMPTRPVGPRVPERNFAQ